MIAYIRHLTFLILHLRIDYLITRNKRRYLICFTLATETKISQVEKKKKKKKSSAASPLNASKKYDKKITQKNVYPYHYFCCFRQSSFATQLMIKDQQLKLTDTKVNPWKPQSPKRQA